MAWSSIFDGKKIIWRVYVVHKNFNERLHLVAACIQTQIAGFVGERSPDCASRPRLSAAQFLLRMLLSIVATGVHDIKNQFNWHTQITPNPFGLLKIVYACNFLKLQ